MSVVPRLWVIVSGVPADRAPTFCAYLRTTVEGVVTTVLSMATLPPEISRPVPGPTARADPPPPVRPSPAAEAAILAASELISSPAPTATLNVPAGDSRGPFPAV